MIRNARMAWLTVFAVTVALAVSQTADAQREEGRREGGGPGGRRLGGGFGAPTLRLATHEEVQAALKLTDEQKSKIEELDEQFRDDFRELLEGGGDREGMRKLSEGTAAQLAEVLDGDQQKRLRGISIQVMGAGAVLADPELAKELEVSDDQTSRLREAQQANMRTMGEAIRELRDLSGDEQRAKGEQLRAEADKRLLDVLTPEQQEKLKSLQGEKVGIDMSELWRRGRGEFGPRGGPGRGERGDRDRSDRHREDSNGEREKSA